MPKKLRRKKRKGGSPAGPDPIPFYGKKRVGMMEIRPFPRPKSIINGIILSLVFNILIYYGLLQYHVDDAATAAVFGSILVSVTIWGAVTVLIVILMATFLLSDRFRTFAVFHTVRLILIAAVSSVGIIYMLSNKFPLTGLAAVDISLYSAFVGVIVHPFSYLAAVTVGKFVRKRKARKAYIRSIKGSLASEGVTHPAAVDWGRAAEIKEDLARIRTGRRMERIFYLTLLVTVALITAAVAAGMGVMDAGETIKLFVQTILTVIITYVVARLIATPSEKGVE